MPPEGVQLKIWLSDDERIVYYDYDGPYVESYSRHVLEKLRREAMESDTPEKVLVTVFDVRDVDFSTLTADEWRESVGWFAEQRRNADDDRPVIFVTNKGFNFGMVRMRSLLDTALESHIVKTMHEANTLANELMSAPRNLVSDET